MKKLLVTRIIYDPTVYSLISRKHNLKICTGYWIIQVIEFTECNYLVFEDTLKHKCLYTYDWSILTVLVYNRYPSKELS